MGRLIDLAGERFGRLVVVARAGTNRNGVALWACRCDCGAEKVIQGAHLRTSHTQSCGCLKHEGHALIDLAGRRLGRLLVLRRVPNRGRRVRWLCQCDCGNTTVVMAGELHAGHTRSCGCLRREDMAALGRSNRRHGQSNGGNGGNPTSTYAIWAGMRQRTGNPNNKDWARYGGRGITCCERWASFENFLADMGERPDWATGGIDRTDPFGNYEPGNCRWSTVKEQAANKRPRAA